MCVLQKLAECEAKGKRKRECRGHFYFTDEVHTLKCECHVNKPTLKFTLDPMFSQHVFQMNLIVVMSRNNRSIRGVEDVLISFFIFVKTRREASVSFAFNFESLTTGNVITQPFARKLIITAKPTRKRETVTCWLEYPNSFYRFD